MPTITQGNFVDLLLTGDATIFVQTDGDASITRDGVLQWRGASGGYPFNAQVSGVYRLTALLRSTYYEVNTEAASQGLSEVPASYYGVFAGTRDMTQQLSDALNAAFFDGHSVILPAGDVNISGLVNVTAPSGSQNYTTSVGTVNWRKPKGVRGYGPIASRIVQNQAGVGAVRYFPASGNFAHGRFKDFSMVNLNEDYTNINQFGIQIGGGSANCVSENHIFESVSGVGLYAVTRLDDCTGALMTGSCQLGRFKYYSEAGYNADQHTFRDFYLSHDHPIAVACTSSTGTTITGISAAVTPFLFVGGTIVGAGVPADTTIVSKTTTTITVNNAVTAVTSFDFKLGTLLSLMGCDGVTWTGSGWATIANAQNYFNKTRASNPNLVLFDSVLWNRGEGLLEDYGSSYALSVRGLYMESCKRVARFAGTGLKALNIDGVFLSQPQSIRQPVIEIVSGVPQGSIKNITTDGTLNTTTVVNAPNINSRSEWGEFEVSNVPGNVVIGGGPTLSALARQVVLGAIRNGTAVLQYSTVGGDANFDGLGVDIIEVTLERSGRTIIGPNSVQIPSYRKLRMVFIQTGAGAFTITLDAKYVKPDGTTWGLLPAGATGLRATLEFTYTGTKYVSDQSSMVYA